MTFLGIPHEIIIDILALALVVSAIIYSFLDGHDLGIGHISLFVKSQSQRTKMIKSVLPYWDGNETWLVLTIGGLIAIFPYAYSYYLQVAYIPVFLLLFSLGFRGICFEFRLKSKLEHLYVWDKVFGVSSVAMSFFLGTFTGIVLNGFIVGKNKVLLSEVASILHPVPLCFGIMFIFMHSFAAIGWLAYKLTKEDSRKLIPIESYFVYLFALFIAISAYSIVITNDLLMSYIYDRGVGGIIISILAISIAVIVFMFEFMMRKRKNNLNKFVYLFVPIVPIIGIFSSIAIALWPMILFPKISIYDAALTGISLIWVFIVVLIFVPIVLLYTVLVHYLFKGKIQDHDHTKY